MVFDYLEKENATLIKNNGFIAKKLNAFKVVCRTKDKEV